MPKYTPAVGLRDAFDTTPITEEQLYRGTTTVAGQGLRAGIAGVKGQLQGLAGRIGETLGADDFAKNRYADSLAAQQEEAQLRPTLSDWRDVHSIGDAGTYLAGQFGAMAPALGAGVVGAALTKNPFVGATLATAPMTIGGAIERQQADPHAMQASLADRNLTAAGSGLVEAAAVNIVPQFFGGKLIGRGVTKEGEHAIAQASKKAILAKNMSEGVIGQGATMAGIEKLHQLEASHFDPNRDTSQDNQNMLDAGISGAIIGAPFGVMGAAGELAHRRTTNTAGDSNSLLGKLTDVAKAAKDKTIDTFTRKEDGGVPVGEFATQAGEFMKKTAIERVTQAKEFGQELLNSEKISDGLRDQVQAHLKTAGDATSQAWLATTKFATDRLDDAKSLNIKKSLTDIWAQATDAVDNAAGKIDPTVLNGIRQKIADGYESATDVDGYRKIFGDLHTAVTNAMKDPASAAESIRSASRKALNDVKEYDFKGLFETTKKKVQESAPYAKMMDVLGGKKDTSDIATARDVAAGSHPLDALDPEMLQNASPEARDAMIAEATTKRNEAINRLKQSLETNGELTPEEHAELKAMGGEVTTPAQQLKVASIALAKDATRRMVEGIDKSWEFITEQYDKMNKGEIKSKSEFGEGIRQVVSDTVMPFIQQHRPEILSKPKTIERIGETIRMIAAVASKSDIDMQGIRFLHSVFGPKVLRDIIAQVGEAVGSDADPMATKNLFKVLGKMQKDEVSTDSARQAVIKGHNKEVLAQRMKDHPDYLDTMVEGIRSHVDGSAYVNMSKERADMQKKDFELAMQREFGAKAKSMLAVFGKAAEKDSPHSQMEREIDDPNLYLDDGHESSNREEDAVSEDKYYGTGKDNALMDHPNVHREKFNSESPAEKVLARERAKNPDHNVEMVRYEDLPQHLQEQYEGSAGKVLVVRRGRANEPERVTEDVMDKIRLDSTKTSHLNSSSRIDTGVKGEIVDARKLVNHFQSEHVTPYNESDDISSRHRLARVFMEGIAAVQDKLGHAFEIPDKTVVAVRGGRDVTWGELKNLKFAPTDKEVSDLTHFLQDATKNEMRKELNHVQSIIDKHDARVDAELKRLRDEGASVQRKIVSDLLETDEVRQARKDVYQIEKAIENHHLKNKVNVGDSDDMTEYVKPEDEINRTSLDGSTIEHTGQPKTKGVTEVDAQIRERIQKMGRSAITGMREMAIDLRDLRSKAVYDSMSKKDRDTLGAKILMAKKASDLKSVVEEMKAKYLPPREMDIEPSQWGGSELKKTEDRSMQQTNRFQTVSPADRAAVEASLKGQLGDQVRVEFGKLFHAGDYERVKNSDGLTHDLIRLSVHSLDPMSTGYHEALHGFIQHMREADLHGVNSALYKAADSLYVKAQLKEFLKNEPEALKQIADSTEERAAYMYQMWAVGKLRLSDAPQSILQKLSNFIKKTLGIWTSDQRAEHIMNYLKEGEYAKSGMGDRSAVARALLESGTNKTFEGIKNTLKPLTKVADNIIGAGDTVLERMNNPAVDKIRKLINSNTSDESAGTGFISASRIERTRVMNSMMDKFKDFNVKPEHLQDALQALQTEKPAATAEGRLAVKAVREILDDTRKYLIKAGVNVGDRGFGKDYFPVVWDVSHIAANQKKFRAMLDKYVRTGDISNPDSIIRNLLANDGNEFGVETKMPGMQSSKTRELHFIKPEDRAEFLQKNLLTTMNSYITQATRRAEWARRFGNDSSVYMRLLDEAKYKHGATDKDLEIVNRFVKGVDGTLGDTIDPGLRRLFGNAVVYQNLRLLPMAVFSMAVDPGGIMVRGGTVKDAFNAFKRGIVEVKRNFQKEPGKDEWYKMAELMGVIDDTALTHTLGSSYSQGMVGDTGRKINDLFFKYNLVEQMNTSMRVSAVPAALGFLARHADGLNSVHSDRWLSELDLKRGDVVVGKNGRPLVTKDEFMAHGQSEKEAIASENKMRLAINKWVDGAILRPNAAHKPMWMNDPHYALIAHLKQFVYSFNETIIKRVLNEAKYGNYTPAYALASYVPTMIAADMIKGMIQGGGSLPTYQQDWTAADFLANGVQRAGIPGISQFGIDAYKDIKFGGTGFGALSGPMLEQLADGAKTMGGREDVGSFLMDSIPASSLVKAVSRVGEAKADKMFVE